MTLKTRKNTHFKKQLYLYSNPRTAQNMAYTYLGKSAILYPGRNPNK